MRLLERLNWRMLWIRMQRRSSGRPRRPSARRRVPTRRSCVDSSMIAARIRPTACTNARSRSLRLRGMRIRCSRASIPGLFRWRSSALRRTIRLGSRWRRPRARRSESMRVRSCGSGSTPSRPKKWEEDTCMRKKDPSRRCSPIFRRTRRRCARRRSTPKPSIPSRAMLRARSLCMRGRGVRSQWEPDRLARSLRWRQDRTLSATGASSQLRVWGRWRLRRPPSRMGSSISTKPLPMLRANTRKRALSWIRSHPKSSSKRAGCSIASKKRLALCRACASMRGRPVRSVSWSSRWIAAAKRRLPGSKAHSCARQASWAPAPPSRLRRCLRSRRTRART